MYIKGMVERSFNPKFPIGLNTGDGDILLLEDPDNKIGIDVRHNPILWMQLESRIDYPGEGSPLIVYSVLKANEQKEEVIPRG